MPWVQALPLAGVSLWKIKQAHRAGDPARSPFSAVVLSLVSRRPYAVLAKTALAYYHSQKGRFLMKKAYSLLLALAMLLALTACGGTGADEAKAFMDYLTTTDAGAVFESVDFTPMA